ncbi:MAG: Hsp20/alpha crystallin family protein [candidate division Zixibacteria bacterium]|nr:Hsp20/alpha crystallin family protein [candidate division Zixibacteria bacterium]
MAEEEKKDFLKDIQRIQEEMDLIFDHFYKIRRSPLLTHAQIWRPPTDVFETGEEIVILTEIAGIDPKKLTILYKEGVLTMKGERSSPKIENSIACRNKEIVSGRFERNIHIPYTVDKESVKASYQDGILVVRLRRLGPEEKTTKIPIV